jgi:ATP-dependent exoDNAse (exonuclease V) beta subunit
VKASSPKSAPSLIGASAGSGKTYRLTQVVTEAVAPSAEPPVELSGLVAVTYTQKGAAELASRIRRRFAGAGAHHATHQLPLAYIGTVHAVCLRLVKEFAIDAGLSPLVDVVPGGEDRLLRQALEEGLEPAFRARLDELAAGVELRLDTKTSRFDWFRPVQDIMTLARSNRIAPERLPRMAERSAQRLLELLGRPEKDGAALDAELLATLRATSKSLGAIEDGQKNTADAIKLVDDSLKKAEAGRLMWSDWLSLQSIRPGKMGLRAVAPLQEVALRVELHPRLHAELRELTACMYEAARQSLGAYDLWKRRRRIIDFVDMLDRALTLLEHPDVRAELTKRFELLVVDEFQDTSPIQLALFIRMHELAGRSSWVGDRKQCIFEYAGADPELMEAVVGWARAAGGSVEQLPHNWRSRPELVGACNALFEAALRPHGYTSAEVSTTPKRTDPSERAALAGLPPLGFWLLDAKNNDDDAVALAEGVRRLLADPAETPVYDRATEQVRGVRAGDIAILVATNAEAERLAEALAPCGVRAAVARAGLLGTPEGTLTMAALHSLLEAGSALSVARIEALTGFRGLEPEAWLKERLTFESQRRAARVANEPGPCPPAASDYVARLESLRSEMQSLSPTEAVDRVLACLDLASLCRRWPDPNQRLANLDALRGLAAAYEQRCTQRREAATIAGLLRFFDEASEKVLVRDEELASDDQHTSTGPDAVTIVTYHRSKGLEWPVVILGSLHRPAKRTVFEVAPETERVSFDPTDPLGGRWIRYWPWPFGSKKAAPLKEAAAASAEGVAISAREQRERARLLYVGFTRARDHLVLTARITKSGYKTEWLDELRDEAGTPLVNLPAAIELDANAAEIVLGAAAGALRVSARCWRLSATTTPAEADDEPPRAWFSAGDGPVTERSSYWIAPSSAGTTWPELQPPVVAELVITGPRLPLGAGSRNEWDIVGNTVHAFLAADLPQLTPAERVARATRLLTAAELHEVLDPSSLLQAGDNLKTWIGKRWPTANWYREVPITAVIASPSGARRVQGIIDLLLELPDGVILIDHKSYPGGRDTWQSKAAEFAPQFAAYEEALRLAGKTVIEQWVSFAIAGGAVRLVRRYAELAGQAPQR